MIEECPICGTPRKAESEFCSLHSDAMKNLEQQYEVWQVAFGETMSRDEYYDRLRNLAETGNAVKRLVEYIQSKKSGNA
jgi:hypothetical protein